MIDKTSDLMLWFIWDFLENIFQFLMLILLFFSVVDHSSPRSTSTIRLRYSYITVEVEGTYSCRFFCPTTPSTKLSWTPGPFTSSIATLCQSWRLVGSPPSLLSHPRSPAGKPWTGQEDWMLSFGRTIFVQVRDLDFAAGVKEWKSSNENRWNTRINFPRWRINISKVPAQNWQSDNWYFSLLELGSRIFRRRIEFKI